MPRERRQFLQGLGAITGLAAFPSLTPRGFLQAATSPGFHQERSFALVGARILPVSGPPIDDGILWIRDKQIAAIGDRSLPLPDSLERIDVQGKWIIPGLVCTHNHVGGIAGGDGSNPIQPGIRVLDSINIRDAGFRRALAGGLTTLNMMPSSGHLISGQTSYVKLRFTKTGPRTIDDLLIRSPDGSPMGGLKMANGTNPMGEPPFPGTRSKSAFLVREQYIKAREYHLKVTQAAGDTSKLPPRDLHLEALIEAMQGKRIVHHHTHRHDDIMTVLRLSQEFGFRVVLHHVSEGWRVAKEIAAAKAPCSVIVIDSPGGKLEARHLRFDTAKVLDEAGVRIAFHTDDYITDSRIFFRMAALAVRGGLSHAKGVDALTLAGAEMLGLEDRVGSLAPGKDADFVLLDGDPLSVYTRVLQTWVEGEVAFDRSREEDRLFAEGGFGAGNESEPYLCCYGQSLQANQ